MDIRERIREFLNGRFSDAILREDGFRGDQSFYVKPDDILHICHALHENGELDVRYLADLTSVDWLGFEAEMGGRFEVIYNLYSLTHKHRFFLKAVLQADQPELPSVTPIWKGAEMMEREVWDLMGIVFAGHPNLTKILTPDDLEGHPLRRDYPLTYEEPQFTWNKDLPPEVIK
ncbi:MAG: NADH-quinone oxidoreductase subunit C [Candidatus Zixiibacteriota bacterium]